MLRTLYTYVKRIGIISGLLVIGVAMMIAASSAALAAGATYYVNPNGDDGNPGISEALPLRTLQRAIDFAAPGDTIELAPGEYYNNIVSRRNGTASSPITITGPTDAVVHGGGNDRVIEINHDHHVLKGFTVNGLHGSSSSRSGYRDTLIYVLGKETRAGVDGLKVLNMTIKNAGGECVRLRYFATNAVIAHNTITDCGVFDFRFNAGGKNGEGIYLGTSSNQWNDGKNPTSDPDASRHNIIHHNYIETNGNECVDIKEGATENVVEYNTCLGQKDTESGGFDSRGNGNVIRYNLVTGSFGAGVRLGGWKVDGVQYGVDNDVYGNTISDNKNGGVKFQETPQGKVCDNVMTGNDGGNSTGTYSDDYNPTTDCGGSSNPSSTDDGGGTSPPPPDDGGGTSPPPPDDGGGDSGGGTGSDPDQDSLANDSTLAAHSNNFSEGYGPSHLWDGCFEGAGFDSNTCTSGGRDIPSFWLEFDLGKLYDLSEARLFGDADGEWVSTTWALRYKEGATSPWILAFSGSDALSNSWLSQKMDVSARVVRLEVFGNSTDFTPGKTQAREFVLYGTESQGVTLVNSRQSTGSSSGSSSSGGSGSSSGQRSIASVRDALESRQPTNPNYVNARNEVNGDGSTTGVQTTPRTNNAPLPAVQTTQVQDIAFPTSLSYGMSNGDVRRLQEYLARDSALYPEGLVTGYFGSLTRAAVRRFQCHYDIVCSGSDVSTGYGRLGPRTRTKLNELYGNGEVSLLQKVARVVEGAIRFTQQLFFGKTGGEVHLLQEYLARDPALYPEGLVTGYFGSLTRAAVQRFQCRHGIACSGTEATTGYGRVGPRTLEKLNEVQE